MANSLLESVRQIVVEEGLHNNRLNETMLSEKLGISRTPIREVLQHLEEEGLIERRPKVGIGLRLLSLREMIEIYDLRSVLEGLASRLLAINPDKKVIAKLENACRKAAEMRESKSAAYSEIEQADLVFHEQLVETCGNVNLKRIVRNCQVLTLSFRITHKLGLKLRIKPLRYTHGQIIEAVRMGNQVEAEEATRRHIEEGKESMIQMFLGPTAVSRSSIYLKH